MTEPNLYPEHEKLKKIASESQVCGEFIDWLAQHDTYLCSPDRRGNYWPNRESITSLLAAFFDIDQKKIDAEKEAMLDAIRAANP